MRYGLTRILPASLTFVVPLYVYFKTSYPSVAFIDSGELAVVCQTLGIAHPSGYPLYTLMGRLFTLFPGPAVTWLNLLSAILVCGSIYFFYLSLKEILSKTDFTAHSGLAWKFALVSFSLFWAFTPTLWSQAVTNEVYSFSVLFLSVITFLALRWKTVHKDQLLYLISFVYGLSFTNHLTTVLLFPALLYLIWSGVGNRLFSIRTVLPSILLFFLGLTLYLYLPIRSSLHPLLDWGHPASWHNFKNHITGWQYQVWMFSGSKSEILLNLKRYAEIFLQQFPLPVAILGGFGFIYLARKKMKIAVFLFLVILLNVLYGINYSIPDIESYFLPSFFAFALLIPSGIWFLLNTLWSKIAGQRAGQVLTVTLLAALVAGFTLARNFKHQDNSTNYLPYDITANVLKSAATPALIITDVWDYCSPFLYMRFVEWKEEKRIMLDKELLRRSWYYDFIKRTYPEIYQRSEKEMGEFLEAVYPFEHQEPFDPAHIEGKYQALLESLIRNNLADKNVYVVLLRPGTFEQNFARVPEGLSYRLTTTLEYSAYHQPEFELKGLEKPSYLQDGRTKFHLSLYPRMLEERAKYEASFGNDSTAQFLNEKARQWRVILGLN